VNVIGVPIIVLLGLLRPRNVKNLVWAGYVTKPISTMIGIKWELRGADILSRDESFVIVSNHQTSLDILGMLDMWHVMDKCTVVAKKELLYVFPFSLAAWLCGLVFIDRKHAEKAKESINNAMAILKNNRIKLWIFPEGTRRNTRELHPFKKGAFHVAISAQVPILPVVYSSYAPFLDKKAKRFDQARIIVTTLPPISTVGLTTNDLESLMEQTREVMMKTFNETTKEVETQMQADNLNKKSQNNRDKVSAALDFSSTIRRVNLR